MIISGFGELLLRLKPPSYERLMQSQVLEAMFGGGEANTLVSLANFGMSTKYITVLPDNELTSAAIMELRKFNIDISAVHKSEYGRMGIYFLETGANQRSSKVLYDREYSALALSEPGYIDFQYDLTGTDWLHVSGITPGISKNAADNTLLAVKTAKNMNLKVSFDLNFRNNLWKYRVEPIKVLSEIMRYSDIVIGSEWDYKMIMGKLNSTENNMDLSKRVMNGFQNLEAIALTVRDGASANQNGWSACLFDGHVYCESKHYIISDIVERVGTGDSFTAGLIYGLNTYESKQEALEFAVAASCLKHSVSGDFNRVSVDEVRTLMDGDTGGRVRR